MAVRELDSSFEGDLLWHGLREIREDNCVSTADIQLPGCSCDRKRYQPGGPSVTLDRDRRFKAVAEVYPANLPKHVEGKAHKVLRNGVQVDEPSCYYDFIPEDDPLEGNPAHCEVRVHENGHRIDEQSRIPPGRQVRLKKELAKAMAVCLTRAGQ